MLDRREILLKRYENVSKQLQAQEDQLQELSQKFTSVLDKVCNARDFDKEREYEKLQIELSKVDAQNREEQQHVERLTDKLEKMQAIGQAIFNNENQLRQTKALRARKELFADNDEPDIVR